MLLPMGYDVPEVVANEVIKRCLEMKNGVYHATAYKIELEANFQRLNCHGDNEDRSCPECSEGWRNCPNDDCDMGDVRCEHCDGDGYNIDDDENRVDCIECDANGTTRCPEECNEGDVRCDYAGCDEGYIHSETSEDTPAWAEEQVCLDFLLQEVADKLGVEYRGEVDTTRVGMHIMYFIRNPFDGVSYAGFYNDGSVDSELTITIDIDKPFIGMEVLAAWKKLGEAIGNGIDTDGAGMHIAILNSPNKTYPEGNSLNLIRAKNFRDAMIRFMPAIYFLGSCEWKSRKLQYRQPTISLPRENEYDTQQAKYCAITGWKNVFEYRVFETCYNKPQAFLDYLCVIAKTLQYYRITPKRLQWFDTFGALGIKDGRGINRFYYTAKHLEALDAGLKALKPNYKTIEVLKKERNFNLTPLKLAHKELVQRCKWQQEYKEYVDRTRRSIVNEEEMLKREWKDRREMGEIPRLMTFKKYLEQVIDHRTRSIQTLDTYIKNKLKNQQSAPYMVQV